MTSEIAYIATVLVIILVSMTFHEAMHGFMAYWLGDTTAKDEGRLTLNPLKHIDPFMTVILPLVLAITGMPVFGGAKPVPFNPYRVKGGEWGAALVGLAGPLTNLLLATIFYAIWTVAGAPLRGVEGMVLTTGVLVNLGFFVFNMLPIPPLDGSRILYALAPDSARRVMEIIEQYGIFVVLGMVLLFGTQVGQLMNALITAIVGLLSTIFGTQML
ncbi:zinc metalloprotease ywhC [Candidatus Saccharibacteria bacterium 32-45-3]|nr:MAG: zinc metalloprotease ywhC [Candidatus Saccharibacteria bacterium 32-45-3]